MKAACGLGSVQQTATRFFTPLLVVSNELPPRNESAALPAEILPHLDGAYNLARYLTRDPVLSEDIVQDAFVRAFQAFAQFRGDSPRAWLFAIVRNCCRTAMRWPRPRPCSRKRSFTGPSRRAHEPARPTPKPGRFGGPQ